MIQVSPYNRTRYWAVYLDGELLAVTVYKKGAVAIAQALARHGYRLESGKTQREAMDRGCLQNSTKYRP